MTLPPELKEAEVCWRAFRNSQLNTISFIKIEDTIPKFCYTEGYNDALQEFTSFLETAKKKLKDKAFCQLCEERMTAKCFENHPEEIKIGWNKVVAVFGGERK